VAYSSVPSSISTRRDICFPVPDFPLLWPQPSPANLPCTFSCRVHIVYDTIDGRTDTCYDGMAGQWIPLGTAPGGVSLCCALYCAGVKHCTTLHSTTLYCCCTSGLPTHVCYMRTVWSGFEFPACFPFSTIPFSQMLQLILQFVWTQMEILRMKRTEIVGVWRP
jgi:hypothetical protein